MDDFAQTAAHLEGAAAGAAAAAGSGAGPESTGGEGGAHGGSAGIGGENVFRAGRPPVPPGGAPPRPNSRTHLLADPGSRSSSQSSLGPAGLPRRDSSGGSENSLPLLGARERSQQQGSSGGSGSLGTEAAPLAATSSWGADREPSLRHSLQEQPASLAAAAPADTTAAAVSRDFSVRMPHPNDAAAPAAAAAGVGSGSLQDAHAATENPLFLPSQLPPLHLAPPPPFAAAAALGPVPYRTVSTESEQLRAAAAAAGVDLSPGKLPPGRSPTGWATPRSDASGPPQPAAAGAFVQHSVAGDLIMPAAVAAAAGPAALAALEPPQPMAPQQQPLAPGLSPMKGGGCGGSLGPSVLTADNPRRVSAEAVLGVDLAPSSDGDSPRKGEGHGVDSEYDFELEERRKPFYRRRTFWRLAIPLFIFLFFLCMGIGFVVLGFHQEITIDGSQLEIWRLCFFIAGLPLIWWSGDLLMRGVVVVVEKTMFTWRNALYFVYAIRKPMTNVLRAAAALGWWAGMMTIGSTNMVDGLRTVYDIILKLWACVTLFMTANLLKTLLAKLLSSKFNKHSHLQKMHEALRKEHMLHMLLQPRPKPTLGLPAGYAEVYVGGPDGGKLGGEGYYRGGEDGGWTVGGGDAAHTPRRSVSEHSMGSLSPSPGGHGGGRRGGGPPSPQRHSSSMAAPGRGGESPELKTSSSFRNMLKFLRPRKQLSTIREESMSEAGGPTHPATAAVDAPASPLGTLPSGSIHISIDGCATPLAPRSPGPKLGASPGKGAGAGGHELERGPSGASGELSRQNSVLSRRSKPLSRQQSLAPSGAGGRGLHRVGALRRASKASDREEKDPRAEAMASANIQVSESMRSERDSEALAAKLTKMEKYIRKNALQVTFHDAMTSTQRRERVTSELEAKKLAFYLFWNVKADFASREITMKDLRDFLPEKDAQRAFTWLDDDADGTITLQDCCSAVVKIFKDRENLAASLKDTKTVVGKLESLLGAVIHTIFCFIYLAIFNVNVMQFYLAFSSLVLAFSFIFNSSLRQMYENVVFLFVIHPFDIGDIIILEGEGYKVDEINLQFTTLINGSNARVWYPNQKMMAAPFINLTASGQKGESFKVLVDLDTPGSVLDEVRAAAEDHLRANPLEYNGTLGVSFNTSANPMKMTLSVYYEYSHNGVDGGRCNRARNKLYILLAQTLSRLGVRYSWPEVRARYTVGAPGSREAAAAEAALLAATTGAAPEVDELKPKLL